ncbi:MAG: hypothetical protein IT300_15985 [Dehalococcoidia bacterium]|nr:hypothetical protein [Dehalococcoidia bacterium]
MADGRDDIHAALEEADRLRRQAKLEADHVRREAKAEADRLRREAKAEADRMRDDARRGRDEARRLRDQVREESRREAHRSRGPQVGRFGSNEDDAEGVRTEQALSLEGIRQVQVDQTAGKLTIRACKEGEAPGVVSIGNKSTPEVDVHRSGDRLVIEVRLTKGWLFRRRQGASTIIRLGEGSFEQVRIDNGYGETEVQGISAADLRVHVGAGTVQCLLTSGSLDVSVGAGKVSVLSHSGLARCDSGTGDVLMDIAELAAGEYKVDVGLGRAEVRLPAGGEVTIKASSGIGKSRVEYPSAPEPAMTSVRVTSGIGECIVKARDAGAGAPSRSAAFTPQPKPQRPGRAAAASRRREGEEMRVLQMLEQGKITPQDAADLIAALQGSSAPIFDEPDDEPGVYQS